MKQGNTHLVLALLLTRHLDAVCAPYTMTLARCQRAPAGLHLGLMQGGAQAYCVETMRQTGDARQSRAAAQKGSGKKGWGNYSGWSGYSGWGNSGSGWENARANWGPPPTTTVQGSAAPGMATQDPLQQEAAPAADAAPEVDPWAGWDEQDQTLSGEAAF